MKKRKNTIARFVAIIALASIVLWVIGTWMLVLFGWNTHNNQSEYTQEELEELIGSFSGTVTASGEVIGE